MSIPFFKIGGFYVVSGKPGALTLFLKRMFTLLLFGFLICLVTCFTVFKLFIKHNCKSFL